MASTEGGERGRENESQFFLTLDATPELQGKHTMFGRVVGQSIYNLVELASVGEMMKDPPNRPRYPPKLIEVKVVENPFDDLRPRMTREERREIGRREREERKRRKEEEEKKEKGRAKKKKNTALLSFGAAEEDEVGEVLKGPKSSHDLLKDDKRLSKQTIVAQNEQEEKVQRNKRREEPTISSRPVEEVESAPTPSTAVVEKPAIGTTYERDEEKRSKRDRDHDSTRKLRPSSSSRSSQNGRDYLSLQRAKYASASKASSSSASSDAYSALLDFQCRLRTSGLSSSSSKPISKAKQADREEEAEADEEEAKEYGSSDDDSNWRAHRLDAGGQPLSSAARAKDKLEDYEVLDPREYKSHGKAAASRDEEEKRREGKRGRDWVESERRYRSDDRHDRGDVRGSGRREDKYPSSGSNRRDGDRNGDRDRHRNGRDDRDRRR